MRLVGPNCLGVLNTPRGSRLNATFMPPAAAPGRVGFLSQSGGLGIAIVDAANRLGLGLSSFVSVGNKADLSGNDFLQYWEQDANTDVILLYLESFGNARKFARIARRVGRTKPIVAVKSGRSAAGARATSSHTGALLAASDVTVDALFRQAGVIRTDTLRRAVRRRRAAVGAAGAARGSRRDRHERRRPRDPLCGRMRGDRAGGRRAAAPASAPELAAFLPAGAASGRPDRHDRDRVGATTTAGRSRRWPTRTPSTRSSRSSSRRW